MEKKIELNGKIYTEKEFKELIGLMFDKYEKDRRALRRADKKQINKKS
jgi:hypothetical protein